MFNTMEFQIKKQLIIDTKFYTVGLELLYYTLISTLALITIPTNTDTTEQIFKNITFRTAPFMEK